jgi:medium-chain acyl-[acyl-carrier-protein] hydrolase
MMSSLFKTSGAIAEAPDLTAAGTFGAHSGPDLPALICLPHAGGNAAFFRSWQAELGDVARIVAAEVAGHGARRNEPVPATMEAALASIWPTVSGHATGRYALFGHSLGALYAVEMARRLQRLGRPPALLIATGRNGPTRRAELADCHDLPEAEFVARLASYGGIPAEIGADPALVRYFLPALRADMRIAERYRCDGGTSLRCPVVVLYGDRDPLVSGPGVAAWRLATTAHCEIGQVPGGHFCVREAGFTGRLRDAVRGYVAAGEGGDRV